MQWAIFLRLYRLPCLSVNRHEVFEIHIYDLFIIWPLGIAHMWDRIWVGVVCCSTPWRRWLWNIRNSDLKRLLECRCFLSGISDFREHLLLAVVYHANGFVQFVFQANVCFQRFTLCCGLLEPCGTPPHFLLLQRHLYLEEIFFNLLFKLSLEEQTHFTAHVCRLATCCIRHQNTFLCLR